MSDMSESTGNGNNDNVIRGIILVIVVLAVFGVLYVKDLPFLQGSDDTTPTEVTTTEENLPTLLDLGSDKCIPCKEMEPVLEELKNEYAGRMKVRFINVRIHPEEGNNYGIRLIPTQIFYNAEGEELFRHEGFFAKKDILLKWEELGITFAD